MASVWLFACLFLYFYVVAKADECVTYNFEHNVDSHFRKDTGVCDGLQLAAWNARSYSEVWIDSPDPDSTSFVIATFSLSCGSTFEFPMAAGGVIEVNAFMESNFYTDQISVFVFQTQPGGNDAVVGSVFMSPTDSVKGWRTLRMTLIGTGTYQGYISIMGMGSPKSLVLVDSFRYIPPTTDESLCVIYKNSTFERNLIYPRAETNTETSAETTTEQTAVTTTESTAETTIETSAETDTEATTEKTSETTTETSTEDTTDSLFTTTALIDTSEECVTYNFESDFDISFSTDNYLCNGLLSWQLDNYTSIDIESPNSESKAFMAPHETASCISSFVFKMEPDGVVEANVFMEPVQELDHIIIIAQRVTENEYDTVAGFVKYHPGNQIFVRGWNLIRFALLDLTSFDGYLIFIGSANSNSTVLVDSIRYIPPLTSPEDTSCDIY